MSRLVLIISVCVVIVGTAAIATVILVRGESSASPQMSEEQRATREKFFGTGKALPPDRKGPGDEAQMVRLVPKATLLIAGVVLLALAESALAQQGQVLTELENQVSTAAKGWETIVMDAAKWLFWILAGIEVGIAAVWLAIQAASLDSCFAELVRRIMFIGFFAFALTQGPTFAKAVVDSLLQIGAGGGSASPAEVFDAGIRVASQMSQQAKFGVFEDNALAIAAVLAMGVVVICFSLVAAIFVSVMVEMYVGGRHDHAWARWILLHQGLCDPLSR